MKTIEVQELKANISEIVRQLQEDRETIEVTDRGKSVILMMPVEGQGNLQTIQEDEIDWTDTDALANEIAKYWPEGVSAVDAVRDVRGYK